MDVFPFLKTSAAHSQLRGRRGAVLAVFPPDKVKTPLQDLQDSKPLG
jgi:hypothetical protein